MNKPLLTLYGIMLTILSFAKLPIEQKITSPERVEYGGFGNVISASGDYMVVSNYNKAVGEITSVGGVYVYHKTTDGSWELSQFILNPDTVQGSLFGFEVALEGNNLAIGATWQIIEDTETKVGAVYFYELDNEGTWVFKQKVYAQAPQESSVFGYSIALKGNIALIGSLFYDIDTKEDAGKAYLFKQNEEGVWEQTDSLMENPAQYSGGFGQSVEISDDLEFLFIGANGSDFNTGSTNEVYAGGVYVYKQNQNGVYEFLQKIIASDVSMFDRFGDALLYKNNQLVVSAYNRGGIDTFEWEPNYNGQGAVYLFSLNNTGLWEEYQKILPPAEQYNTYGNQFGRNVAIDDSSMYISEPKFDLHKGRTDQTLGAGILYQYKMNPNGQWVWADSIVSPFTKEYDYFAHVVLFNEGQLIVSHHLDDEDENEENVITNSGSIYIYGTDDLVTNATISIDQNNEIFPNPATNTLYLPAYNGVRDLEIFSVTGNKVLSVDSYHHQSLDIETLPAGYYIIFIGDESTKTSYSFVKY